MTMQILAEHAYFCNVRRKRYAQNYISVSDKFIVDCNRIQCDREVERLMISDVGLCHIENSVGRYSGCYLFNALFYQKGADGRMRWYDRCTGHLLSFLVHQFKKRQDAEKINKYKWQKVNGKHCYITTRDNLIFELKLTNKTLQNALKKLIDHQLIEITHKKHELIPYQKSMQIFLNWNAIYALLSKLIIECPDHPIFIDPLRNFDKKDKYKYFFYQNILNVCIRAFRNYDLFRSAKP